MSNGCRSAVVVAPLLLSVELSLGGPALGVAVLPPNPLPLPAFGALDGPEDALFRLV
jgi:hypothetical protein